MHAPVITALYAGILALIGVGLALGAGSLRGSTKISIGDGGNSELLLAMRRHGNWAEWVPMAVILIALLEMNGVRGTAIHALGAVLVVARVAHPIGLQADTIQGVGRIIGATGSVLVTIVAAIWAIVVFF